MRFGRLSRSFPDEVFSVFPQIIYAAVDCTKGQNHELCKHEGVEGYPTFNHYNYGKFVEKYNGERGVSHVTSVCVLVPNLILSLYWPVCLQRIFLTLAEFSQFEAFILTRLQ